MNTHTAIREYDAKLLLAYWLERAPAVDQNAQIKTKLAFPSPKVAQISWDPETKTITPDSQLPGWVFNTKLVAKPDQLIKRRGKAGLLALNKTWDEAKEWIQQRAGKPQRVSLPALSPSLRSPVWDCSGPLSPLCSLVIAIDIYILSSSQLADDSSHYALRTACA